MDISNELVDKSKVLTMIQRALNMVNPHLVDHGTKVALILQDMLRVENRTDPKTRSELLILALLHDIGAFREEEISRLVQIETHDVWEHSIYSYLFLRDYFCQEGLAKVILYHHADFNKPWEGRKEILHYGQMLHVADRVAIWHDEVRQSREKLATHFSQRSGTVFSPECISLFWKADALYGTWDSLKGPVSLDALTDCEELSQENAEEYLFILASAIDFRSRNTVIHTRGVMEIAIEMAKHLKLPLETQKKLYYAALLHDLGKIGIPIEILEKPGRLTPEEMSIMQGHILLGEQIVEGFVDPEVVKIAMRHHEKLNGSGYPRGLSAEELTLPQRLLAVADIVSALCMARSYKEAFPKERCLAILRDMADQGQLDDGMVSLVEQHFDTIMAWASRRCDPVLDYYDHLTKEAAQMMMYFSTPPTDPLPPCGSGDDRPILM